MKRLFWMWQTGFNVFAILLIVLLVVIFIKGLLLTIKSLKCHYYQSIFKKLNFARDENDLPNKNTQILRGQNTNLNLNNFGCLLFASLLRS